MVPAPVLLPVAFTAFPGEIFRAPRTWIEQAYPTLTSYHHAERGGHFAAWEEPQLFADEMRAAFSSLRRHEAGQLSCRWCDSDGALR